MTIISSQHYLNWETVEAKAEELKNANVSALSVPVVACHIDGETYGIVIDAHHRMAAAKEIGIEVCFEEVDNAYGCDGEALLEAAYMDGDYYLVETSDPAAEQFDLVW
jgi:hypothetical protein